MEYFQVLGNMILLHNFPFAKAIANINYIFKIWSDIILPQMKSPETTGLRFELTPKEIQTVGELPLRSSFDGKGIPSLQVKAIELLDNFDLNLNSKRLLFFFYLWHETGSFASIREYTGIQRDSSIHSMLDRVMDDDNLVEKYNSFYAKLQEEKALDGKEELRAILKEEHLLENVIE